MGLLSIKTHTTSNGQVDRLPEARTVLVGKARDVTNEAKANVLEAAVGASMTGWKTEFHIVDAQRSDGTFMIPFFSRIKLPDESCNLKVMAYNVALRFIRTPTTKTISVKPSNLAKSAFCASLTLVRGEAICTLGSRQPLKENSRVADIRMQLKTSRRRRKRSISRLVLNLKDLVGRGQNPHF